MRSAVSTFVMATLISTRVWANCSTSHGNDRPSLEFSPVVRGEAGVCYFWVRGMGANVNVNEFPKRTLRMQMAHGACPNPDDANYIENTNVPDGIFVAIMNAWSETLSSSKGGFQFPPFSDADRKIGMDDFATLVKTSEGKKRLSIVGVDANSFGPDSSMTLEARAGGIDLVVIDSEQPSMTYYLIVDWVGDRFQIVGINTIISGC